MQCTELIDYLEGLIWEAANLGAPEVEIVALEERLTRARTRACKAEFHLRCALKWLTRALAAGYARQANWRRDFAAYNYRIYALLICEAS